MSADKRFRKVAFAEIALQRMRGRSLSGGSNLNRPGDLKITIERASNPTLVEQPGDSFARVDSYTSETDSESDVIGIRGRNPGNLSPRDSSTKTSRPSLKSEVNKDTPAPEQAITLFAFRLAILEKTSRGAGTLTFVWATVVLLGGFSQYINKIDFWVVTILLLTEGSRILFLSNELEWQQARFRSSFSLYEFGSNLARRSSRYFSGACLSALLVCVTLAACKSIFRSENSVAIAISWIFHESLRTRLTTFLMRWCSGLVCRSPVRSSSSDDRLQIDLKFSRHSHSISWFGCWCLLSYAMSRSYSSFSS